jgi:hypothetical protein
VVKNHPSVDWTEYFARIRAVCPWSGAAWRADEIDIVRTRKILPLAPYRARIYIMPLSRRRLKKLAASRDHGPDEWLWSHPSYGANGAPLPCLIQQDRAELERLRGLVRSQTTVIGTGHACAGK